MFQLSTLFICGVSLEQFPCIFGHVAAKFEDCPARMANNQLSCH